MSDTAKALKPVKLGSWLLNECIPTASLPSKLTSRVARKVRRLILSRKDVPIKFTYNGVVLVAPLSHDLPLIAANFPRNSINFGEVVAQTAKASANLLVIDVGANIGDSVVLGGLLPNVRYLCIEGAEEFIPYLKTNTLGRADVHVAHVIVGQEGESITIQTKLGSGKAVAGSKGSTAVKPLDMIVKEYGWDGNGSVLLKVDTDGFDAQILVQSSSFIETYHPNIFFEFDPVLADQSKVSPTAAIDFLISAGYTTFETWDKYGSRLIGAEGSDASRVFEELSRYCREASKNFGDSTMYLDVLARVSPKVSGSESS
jgi:FkbM family methyltransferase